MTALVVVVPVGAAVSQPLASSFSSAPGTEPLVFAGSPSQRAPSSYGSRMQFMNLAAPIMNTRVTGSQQSYKLSILHRAGPRVLKPY